MDTQGDAKVSKTLKQPLALILLLSTLAQPALANGGAPAGSCTASAPAQAPVQLSWDRVGDRERSLV
jgi:hypothetical protein